VLGLGEERNGRLLGERAGLALVCDDFHRPSLGAARRHRDERE
jgi:hypothetical protein